MSSPINFRARGARRAAIAPTPHPMSAMRSLFSNGIARINGRDKAIIAGAQNFRYERAALP